MATEPSSSPSAATLIADTARRIAHALDRSHVGRLLQLCRSWECSLRSGGLERCTLNTSACDLFALLSLQETLSTILSSLHPRVPDVYVARESHDDRSPTLLLAHLQKDASLSTWPSWTNRVCWECQRDEGEYSWEESWKPLRHTELLRAWHQHSDYRSAPACGVGSLLELSALLRSYGEEALVAEWRYRVGSVATLNPVEMSSLSSYKCEQREWRLRYIPDPLGTRGCRAQACYLTELALFLQAGPARDEAARLAVNGWDWPAPEFTYEQQRCNLM
eukprot:TRINITY_DN74162_c0_g1_i1.p1 TRINITY_DN74162_c0_g1~~TRINITY_DN74162_c0_g1_i1.p1  ORF type:complete len:277 (-),score=25.48 TRINITY_DN74162_c0_g1_i1:109-939(-)